MTIEQGGTVLSLELVKKNTLTDIYYKKTHESFTDFINNNHIDSLHGQAKELGLDPSHYFSVSVFKIKAGQDLQALELNIHRLVSFIKKSFPNLSLLVYGFHNKVNLLISTPHLSDQERMSEKLDDLMKKWQQNNGETFAAGVGSTYRGIGNIANSYDEAQKALEYLINRNDSAIIHYEEIGVNRLFVHQQPQEIEFFLEETLAPLKSDKDNNDLEETLVSYIQLNKSAVDTAKKLHIHINTLYNRLRKIEELLEVSFQDPEDNLKIQLACHLRSSYKPL
ncbi:PucR family transcriptional regulator [Lacicoccus qingdaonensis]|uniref:PucR C-terminal helix-turn-helix domain-containing protein n=1 Tax=Lacicoccus qingdaonensis TaxID=576118 RepID=A0A1G9G6Z6_9BACL|nr:helix-turn-helix domain-containing protein [Salinicoccus qingdaonensis]SDK96416.1 PucR C-terminal helix-turn-helix domain-containing protein [Salinicoccus qingdaonensis]